MGELIVQVSAGLIVLMLAWRARYEMRIHRAVERIETATNGKLDRRLDGIDKRIDKLETAVLAGQQELTKLFIAFTAPAKAPSPPKPRASVAKAKGRK